MVWGNDFLVLSLFVKNKDCFRLVTRGNSFMPFLVTDVCKIRTNRPYTRSWIGEVFSRIHTDYNYTKSCSLENPSSLRMLNLAPTKTIAHTSVTTNFSQTIEL